VVIPQTKDLPAIVYSIAGAEPSHSNDGASKLDKFTFNLICVARNYTLVDDMAAKVRAALHAYNTGPVQSIRYQTEMDDFDIETLAYLRVMTFTLRLKL
jgi:hypothetical protein